MKRFLSLALAGCFGLLLGAQGVGAATIDVIQNGDFEANGGSLNHWSEYGDIDLITEASGNHFVRLGFNTTDGNSLISQAFRISSDENQNQTLSFTYSFNFIDTPTTYAKMDIFATRIRDTMGNVIETPLLLASYDTSDWVNLSGVYTEVLDPQLTEGVYYLKFALTENSGQQTDSYIDLDNISLTAQVPEPATLIMVGSAMLGAAAIRRRFKKG